MAQGVINTPRETTHQRIADALEDMAQNMSDAHEAVNIDYDNTQSGLSADKVQGAVDELASEKVDKVQGKGLSTNDYTDDDKNKLAGIEAGANKTVVDFFMSDSSTNPLQNRVVNAFLNEKTDINNFNALTQEFELFNTYDLTNDVEISVFANKTYKRDKYDRAYETHVPNLDGEYSVSLGDKTFTETCTFTIANEGKSITEVYHTNRKYILGAKLLKAENDEVGDAYVIADVVTLLISKDAPYTTTFDPDLEHPPATGVLTLKVSVKPDEKYVNGIDEPAYWGSYNGSDLLINNPILTYSETTFGQPKVSGNPVTINDAAEANAVDVSVDIKPIQDLHGYDHPWVGGAGKNKLQVTGTTQTIDGVTFTVNDDGSIIVNGTFEKQTNFLINSSCYLKAGNYILNGVPSDPSWSTFQMYIVANGNKYASVNGTQFTIDEDGEYPVYISIYGELSGTLIFKPMIRLATETDPTFESYSNICSISGWDEVNVGASGVNIWDEQTELGIYDQTTGEKQNYTGHSRSVNKIRIEGGTQYYLKLGQGLSHVRVFYYTANSYISTIPLVSGLFTPPNNAEYMTFQFSGTTYNNDISINYPSTDTEYHAYKGKTYTIQLKDEQGNPITVYGGECDVVNGSGTDKLGYVDLGTLNWGYYASGSFMAPYFYADVSNLNIKYEGVFSTTVYHLQCSQYESVARNSASTVDGKMCADGVVAQKTVTQIQIKDSRFTDATSFKQAMNGVQLVYELATPQIIQLTPQQIRLLKGTNNITCNTGDLSIKYYPDNVLGQLKGDIESEYDDRVETLETQVQELQPSLIFMSRERRDITSDLGRLSTAVAEQNLAKYGYKIGDYFTGASRYTYILADYNTFKGTSTPYCITTNHLGIVVDTHQTSQWHSEDASSVGYNGSTLHTYLKGTVMDNIKADMIALFGGSTGLEHLLSHSKLLTTALENWGWQSNQYISALSEVQVFGSRVWGANGYQTGEASKKLELFDRYKWTEIFGNEYPWLRDMSSASYACIAHPNGGAASPSVTDSLFAVGLINFY